MQRAFGYICLAYQLHIRSELQNEKDQFYTEFQQQRERFKQEREEELKRVKEAFQLREQQEAEHVARMEMEIKNKEVEINALKENFDAEREDLKERLRNAEQRKLVHGSPILQ